MIQFSHSILGQRSRNANVSGDVDPYHFGLVAKKTSLKLIIQSISLFFGAFGFLWGNKLNFLDFTSDP